MKFFWEPLSAEIKATCEISIVLAIFNAHCFILGVVNLNPAHFRCYKKLNFSHSLKISPVTNY